jgi:superoxide reductase
MLHDSGVKIICCGEPMAELKANTTDAAKEKHVPVAVKTADLIKVSVGSVAHPMQEEHFIEWIYVQTAKGGQRKVLRPGAEPAAAFALTDDEAVAVYAYCNLHGLWKVTL